MDHPRFDPQNTGKPYPCIDGSPPAWLSRDGAEWLRSSGIGVEVVRNEMAIIGLIVSLLLFRHYLRRLQVSRAERWNVCSTRPDGILSWHDQWHRQWAEKFHRQAERRLRHLERRAERRIRFINKQAQRFGLRFQPVPVPDALLLPDFTTSPVDAEVLRRARRRARSEVGFYTHLMVYLGVLAFLALINILTTDYPWFLWPAIGWGIGLFAHYMASFGARMVRERYFQPAVDREVRREKMFMHTEKQASIDELSATIAHEIRNPIAAAKSLVQQMGEHPDSPENVQYAEIAVSELDRVERRISHLLKYAKEEDYDFRNVKITDVVDDALVQMRAKLEAARVTIHRNCTEVPAIWADAEKLRNVFANILDNAIDAMEVVAEGRRIDLSIENGARLPSGAAASVRIRDNGCGISADKIDRTFNPFFTTKVNGTGLGMAISKKIIEAHEGTIDVLSEQGRGTEFVIVLPLSQD